MLFTWTFLYCLPVYYTLSGLVKCFADNLGSMVTSFRVMFPLLQFNNPKAKSHTVYSFWNNKFSLYKLSKHKEIFFFYYTHIHNYYCRKEDPQYELDKSDHCLTWTAHILAIITCESYIILDHIVIIFLSLWIQWLISTYVITA